MSLLKKIRTLFTCELGAISVDWVVITAMVVGLGLAVAIVISDGLSSTSVVIGNTIDSAPSAVPINDGNDEDDG